MQKLTIEQACIIQAYTGIGMGVGWAFIEYAEKKLGRELSSGELNFSPTIQDEIKAAAREDFLALCP